MGVQPISGRPGQPQWGGIWPELRTRPPATFCGLFHSPLLKLFFIIFGSLGFCWASPSAASWGACCGRDEPP
jgi:hypothetical protein